MIRRLAFIPFEMQLTEDEIDIKLEMKLTEDIDNLRYILTGGIFAYRKAVERGKLTEIPKQKDLMDDFLEENQTPVDLFYNHLLSEEGNGDKEALYIFLNGRTTEDIYGIYKKFREEIGINAKDIEIQKTFTGRFKRKLPSKIQLINHTIGGVSFRTYTLKQ